MLIDAGVGEAAHVNAIAAASEAGPGHVVVSHAHGDHISGVTALADRWSHTRFSKVPWPERDQKHPVTWWPLADDDVIAAGDSELRVVHTPGHAPDHIAFWHPFSRTLFSGDLVVQGTTVVIPATAGGSLSQYLESLRRVLALQPARLLPAHGAVIENPTTIIEQYIEHRYQREAQVRSAVQSGITSTDAIVARIYVGLPAPLIPMARESVLAHLYKLEAEGVVRAADGEWQIAR